MPASPIAISLESGCQLHATARIHGPLSLAPLTVSDLHLPSTLLLKDSISCLFPGPWQNLKTARNKFGKKHSNLEASRCRSRLSNMISQLLVTTLQRASKKCIKSILSILTCQYSTTMSAWLKFMTITQKASTISKSMA